VLPVYASWLSATMIFVSLSTMVHSVSDPQLSIFKPICNVAPTHGVGAAVGAGSLVEMVMVASLPLIESTVTKTSSVVPA